MTIRDDIADVIDDLANATAKHEYAYAAGRAVEILNAVTVRLDELEPKESAAADPRDNIKTTHRDHVHFVNPVAYSDDITGPELIRRKLTEVIEAALAEISERAFTAPSPIAVRTKKAQLIAEAIVGRDDLNVSAHFPRFNAARFTNE